MQDTKQGFPDDYDRQLARAAEGAAEFAHTLVEWAGDHAAARLGTDFSVGGDGEFSLLRLRRLAANLCRSAEVPVAAAVYGASQVGKSLFMGRVLAADDVRFSPLGRNELPHAYIPELSFEWDVNPQCGSYEATALVTRITTGERFDAEALPDYPVKVRALTRAEWLRVLARGFRSECLQPKNVVWNENTLRTLFEETSDGQAAETVDREWRGDLLDAYAYLRNIDPRQYAETESIFNALLSRYPLTPNGYVEIAGRLFWDSRNFPGLTALFNDVCRFLQKITQHGRDGILVHWAAVKFLLDSQRAPVHRTPQSRWKPQVAWTDLKDGFREGWYVLDYEPGGTGPKEDQATIQSAMLELILPVLPTRLKEDWRDVLHRMDLLDLPGMKAGGSDTQGGATKIESIPEKMNVVKRGKVFYLIERYIEERQIQTLLLLIRGGGLEVRQLLKEYVDKWGRARYGEDAWPRRLSPAEPAFFIGLTGIDDEFFKHQVVNHLLYENRLNQLENETLYEVMTDFGGEGRPFTNVYPIRYPGTWDADESQRRQTGRPEKWDQARDIFVNTPLVKKYVHDAPFKWDVAMRDDDGGMSLICQGFVACTTSLQKQQALDRQIRQIWSELLNLAAPWYCDPVKNVDRQKRKDLAVRVLAWLDDERLAYDRVHALQSALCFEEGDTFLIAEFAETRQARSRVRPETIEERFPAFLKETITEWSRDLANSRWHQYVSQHQAGAPWLPSDDFSALSRYLGEYLTADGVFVELTGRLLRLVNLPIEDAGDRRHAQREYARVILNDFVLNPGPNDSPLETIDPSGLERFGLMAPFVRRWKERLGEALASAAGEHRHIPSGNDELREILEQFRRRFDQHCR